MNTEMKKKTNDFFLSLLGETLMTIRALRDCKQHKIQEFARIILVADIFKHVRMLEDHEPLKERPAFESLDVAKIVSIEICCY